MTAGECLGVADSELGGEPVEVPVIVDGCRPVVVVFVSDVKVVGDATAGIARRSRLRASVEPRGGGLEYVNEILMDDDLMGAWSWVSALATQ